MKYKSGAAFRKALENRLLRQSQHESIPLFWLRKMVVFDRYLARLVNGQTDAWLLKGGVALQLRLGERSRTTKDLDILLKEARPDLHQTLVRVALIDLADWFLFEVRAPDQLDEEAPGVGYRFLVAAMLDGRLFEHFHLDVGVGNPVRGQPEMFKMPPLLSFAGIGATAIPCYPITQHLAEKVHAYTRPHPSGPSTRVKDLVDILLLAEAEPFDQSELSAALQTTFTYWGTHEPPWTLPNPTASWSTPFLRMSREVGLLYHSLGEAVAAARRFLNPVLQGGKGKFWNATTWSWQTSEQKEEEHNGSIYPSA